MGIINWLIGKPDPMENIMKTPRMRAALAKNKRISDSLKKRICGVLGCLVKEGSVNHGINYTCQRCGKTHRIEWPRA